MVDFSTYSWCSNPGTDASEAPLDLESSDVETAVTKKAQTLLAYLDGYGNVRISILPHGALARPAAGDAVGRGEPKEKSSLRSSFDSKSRRNSSKQLTLSMDMICRSLDARMPVGTSAGVSVSVGDECALLIRTIPR